MTGLCDGGDRGLPLERINAKSFTIDGEAVVLGPDGLSQFEELSRRGRSNRNPLRLRPYRA
jgi:ATP-dependent DNA ligase